MQSAPSSAPDPSELQDSPLANAPLDVSEADAQVDPLPQDRSLGSWLGLLLIALVLVLLVQAFVVRPYRIPSESMLPTLEVGDRVAVNRLSYTAGSIERGQVIVFDRPPLLPGTDAVIKRVIGLPGELVRFSNGSVYIGDQRMVEPYVVEGVLTRAPSTIPGCDLANTATFGCLVPEGFVFVLGDNRNASDDSRTFGPVAIDTIVGRAAVRIWPPLDINQL